MGTAEGLRELLQRHRLALAQFDGYLGRLVGLSDTEIEAIAHLSRAGHLTSGQLARLLGLTSGGLAALRQRLEAGGWIAAEPNPRDKRSTFIYASDKTKQTLTGYYRALTEQIDETSNNLRPETRAEIEAWLQQVAAIAEHHAEQLRQQCERHAVNEVPAGSPEPGLWA